jgi:hypothetical protein
MKIKEPISIEDNNLRLGAVSTEQKKSIPSIILIVLIAILAVFCYKWYSAAEIVSRYGVGNPYNCQDCKDAQRACEEHRYFDKEAFLKNEITRYATNMSDTDHEYTELEYYYGRGNKYNTECDFCNSSESECYADKYNRLYISDAYNRISGTSLFKSELCDDCWVLGYPKCSDCIQIMVNSIYDDIKGN